MTEPTQEHIGKVFNITGCFMCW